MSVAVSGAEGGVTQSHCTSTDHEDSSVLADLLAMFPALDHDVIATVLQSHHGQLESAVEYLMATSLGASGEQYLSDVEEDTGRVKPHYHPQGQYGEDLGGVPEIVPVFIQEEGGYESDEETDESSRSPSPSTDEQVDPEDDPLPTYEEACMGTDILPMATYVVDEEWEGPEEEGCHHTTAAGSQNEDTAETLEVPSQIQSVPVVQPPTLKKGKRKKLKKLAKKLRVRKSKPDDSVKTRQKRVPIPSSYQRLVDRGDVFDDGGDGGLEEDCSDS